MNTSVAGQVGLPNISIYSASKAALRSLTRTLAAELLGRRIRVNAVAPGPISSTAIQREVGSAEEVKKNEEWLASQLPMKRLGTVQEVAKAVLFLAADDASYITGVEPPRRSVRGGNGRSVIRRTAL
jgi:NAD(P)-dependent dehydrogenase (short-subunit alcohol dehydrogenase family)